MVHLFTIASDALSADVHLVAFRGEEAFNQPYVFEILLLAKNSEELDLDDVTGSRSTLTWNRLDAPVQVVHGMFASVELLHTWQGQTLYRATLVPKLWQAGLSQHSRNFVDKSTPEILEEVLAEAGMTGDDYVLRLDGSYPPLLNVLQHQESDLAFLTRRMEREGIYYYFEQGDGAEKLVITDHRSFHAPGPPKKCQYMPSSAEDMSANEAFESFTCRRAMLPKQVGTRDYHYLNPTLDLAHDRDVDRGGAVVRYGDNVQTPDEAKRLAGVRAEELLATRRTVQAKGRVFHLRVGYTFEIENHPMDGAYLPTRITHRANQSAGLEKIKKLLDLPKDDAYTVELDAIPADVQYRPPLCTPIPRVDGVLSAVVDGPADSPYAQLDDQGRYRVRLLLDEAGRPDGAASMWVRMAQPHGGETEGMHFPLRKGTEVILVFLGGDPDRPIICGAVPNARKPAPVTSSNHTYNILVTGGSNYVAMQDLEGSQYIDISSPPEKTWMHLGAIHDDEMGSHTHNIVLNTDGICLFNIGGTQDIEVGGDLNEHVVGDVWEDYENDQDSFVGGDQTLEVVNDRDVEVGGDMTFEVACDFDTEVGGDCTLEVAGDFDTEVGGDVTLEGGGDHDVEIAGDCTLEGGGDYDIELAGDYTLEAAGDQVGLLGGNFEYTVGGNWTQTITGDYTNTHAGSNKFWTVGNEAKGTVGSCFEIFIGNKAEVKIGNFLEAALSNKIGMHLGGVDITLAASLRLGVTGGASITMDSSVRVTVAGGVDLGTAPTILKAAGMIINM